MMERIYRWFVKPHWGKLRIDGRLIASLSLVVLAIIISLWKQNTSNFLRLGAMGFSFIGDSILMNAWNIPKRLFKKGYFIVGGASFAIAQTIYAKSFWILVPEHSRDETFWVIYLAILVIITSVIIEMTLATILKCKRMYSFSALFSIYFIFLIINGTCILLAMVTRYVEIYEGILLALAIISFILSDTIIKFEKTASLDSDRWKFIKWATYIAAQVGFICVI